MPDSHDSTPQSRAGALREAARRAAEARDRRAGAPVDDDGLDDTKALEDTVADAEAGVRAPPDADPTYDDLFGHDIVGLDEVDPEAGSMGVAKRVRQVRQAAATPGGRMVTAIPLVLAGIALGIFAAVHRTTPLLVAAGVLTPATIAWWVVCYRRWLGHKRYVYRVLESLGEDVSGFTPAEMYRLGRQRRGRRGRRR